MSIRAAARTQEIVEVTTWIEEGARSSAAIPPEPANSRAGRRTCTDARS